MADAADVAEINAGAFRRPWGLTEFERLLAERNVVAHVIEAPETAGFALSRLAAGEAEILSIAVRPRRRGEGLAGQLLVLHLEALALLRAQAVFLEVEEGNTPALRLYRRHRFAEVARRESYYRKEDGTAATAIVMRRAP